MVCFLLKVDADNCILHGCRSYDANSRDSPLKIARLIQFAPNLPTNVCQLLLCLWTGQRGFIGSLFLMSIIIVFDLW